MAAIWPTIPEVADAPESHTLPLRSMKNILEIITGLRLGPPRNFVVPKLFRTQFAPGGTNSPVLKNQLQDGDLWIDTANSNKLRFWDAAGQFWTPTT